MVCRTTTLSCSACVMGALAYYRWFRDSMIVVHTYPLVRRVRDPAHADSGVSCLEILPQRETACIWSNPPDPDHPFNAFNWQYAPSWAKSESSSVTDYEELPPAAWPTSPRMRAAGHLVGRKREAPCAVPKRCSDMFRNEGATRRAGLTLFLVAGESQQRTGPRVPIARAEPKMLSLRDLNPLPPALKTGSLNAELSPRYSEAWEIATFDIASSDGLCAKGSMTRLSRCNFRQR